MRPEIRQKMAIALLTALTLSGVAGCDGTGTGKTEQTALGMLLQSQTKTEVGSETESRLGKGYYASWAVWPSQSISVCWESGAYDVEKSWVKTAITNTWQLHSQLQFTGWNTCGGAGANIRISIQDVQPQTKGIGNQLNNVVDGVVLNFNYNNWCTECHANREANIKTNAIHEFGYAIGITHEQNRYDRPADCTAAPQGVDGDTYVGAFDRESIMNDCYNSSSQGKLSSGDITTVQQMYGANTGTVFQRYFADVNGDGRVDLIQTGPELTSWVGLADENGKFATWTYRIATGRAGGAYQHHFADVNGDGRADMVQTGPHLTTWVGLANIDGKFQIWTHILATGRNGTSYEHHFADVNGDGRADMIRTGPDLTTWVGLADLSGKHQTWSHVIATGRSGTAYKHYFADVNGDQRVDLIQTGPNLSTWVGLADVTGRFQIWTHGIATGRNGTTYQHHFADLNGDGRADMIQTGSGLVSWVALADTSGKFQIWSHGISTGRSNTSYEHHFADLNGDGRADLIQTGPDLISWIGLTDAGGNVQIWTHGLATGRSGTTYEHYFADVNGDGREDLIQTYPNTLTWVGLSNGAGLPQIWTYGMSTGGSETY